MRQLLILVFIIASTFGIRMNAQTADSLSVQDIRNNKESVTFSGVQAAFDESRKEYDDKNYPKAIAILETAIAKLKERGEVAPELYYNLGNAYFRMDEYPEAMLNYERAQLYDSGDRDIKHNIEYAQSKIEDKILTADTFFLRIWFRSVQNLFNSNTWSVISIVFFVLFIICLFLFFFSSVLSRKKIGFYAGVVLLVLLLFTNVFARNQKTKIERQNTAIVMAGSVTVVSSPSGASTDLFTLHAGTKVEIVKEEGIWYEIEIADGNVGWIKKETVEVI